MKSDGKPRISLAWPSGGVWLGRPLLGVISYKLEASCTHSFLNEEVCTDSTHALCQAEADELLTAIETEEDELQALQMQASSHTNFDLCNAHVFQLVQKLASDATQTLLLKLELCSTVNTVTKG